MEGKEKNGLLRKPCTLESGWWKWEAKPSA